MLNCSKNPPVSQAFTDASWYLLQCKPQQETRAEAHLMNQGYACFLPRLEQEKLRGSQRQTVATPLFPGYLFIHLDQQTDNWSAIRSTRGVVRLVSFGGQPQSVSNDLIAALRDRVAKAPRAPALQTGDRIKVTEGAFVDIEAIFNTWAGEDRVVILLNLMRREHRLVLPLRCVQKLPAA